MKRIGLIGGLSPESTIHYYKALCDTCNQRAGGLNFPEIVIDSLNLQRLADLFGHNEWDKVGPILPASPDRLRAAGADFAAILANTPHNACGLIQKESRLPIYTIMDATEAALNRDGIRRAGLPGTKATMESGFFQKHFAVCGIEVSVPEEVDRNQLDRVIRNEPAHGRIEPASQEAARKMIEDPENQGAEALVLGCTELGLLIQKEHTRLPLHDTLYLHAAGILEFALGSPPDAGGVAASGASLASSLRFQADHPDR